MNKLFIKSLLGWIGLTTIVTYLNVNAFIVQRYLLAYGLLPLTITLLLVPFYGQKMSAFVTEATLHYQQYNIFGKKK